MAKIFCKIAIYWPSKHFCFQISDFWLKSNFSNLKNALPSKTYRAYIFFAIFSLLRFRYMQLHAATEFSSGNLKGNLRNLVLGYMKSYGSVQSSILRRISCSTLVEQQMKRPVSKINENCEHKMCAPTGARSTKKKLYSSLHSFQKNSSPSSNSSLPHTTPRSDFKF